MKVTHTKSKIIQYNEYYPFGLQASTSWTRENTYGNAYLYNEGSELNSTTGWYEMFYRGYDAALGRMFQVDPFASLYSSHSVYNYAINSPAQLNDPDGGRVAHPGNGHWSDGIGQPFWTLNGSQGDNHNGGYGGSGYSSAQKRDYFLMRASAFQSKYGIHPGRIGFENGQMKVKVWNPVGGELAYSNSYEKDGKTYIDNYYYGAWQLQQQTQNGPHHIKLVQQSENFEWWTETIGYPSKSGIGWSTPPITIKTAVIIIYKQDGSIQEFIAGSIKIVDDKSKKTDLYISKELNTLIQGSILHHSPRNSESAVFKTLDTAQLNV